MRININPMNRLVILLCFLFFLYACSSAQFPYKINIQQGNDLKQAMLDRLEPGMDKEQVQFIMGTPAILDPFHKDRWDYIYSFQRGDNIREQRHITLHFEDDKLIYISGDVQAADSW